MPEWFTLDISQMQTLRNKRNIVPCQNSKLWAPKHTKKTTTFFTDWLMRTTEAVQFLVQIIEIITLGNFLISEDCLSRITYGRRFQPSIPVHLNADHHWPCREIFE